MTGSGVVLRGALFAAREQLRLALRRRRRRRFRPTLLHDPARIPEQVLQEARCCFALSTGRCGTALLTKLLDRCTDVDVRHQPVPSLLYLSKLAYLAGPEGLAERSAGILHARYEMVRESYVTGGVFVETNNRITFFASELAALFRRSCFIHIVRHPGSFATSALLRHYYSGSKTDEGRIVPRADDPLSEHWSHLSAVQRVGWLWNETNSEIEAFKSTLAPERMLTVRAEDLFADTAESGRIFEFLGVRTPKPRRLARLIAKPVNAQAGDSHVPRWPHWPDDWTEELAAVCPLAPTYGYRFDS